MLDVRKQGNTIVVKGLDHALYPYQGTLEIPCNSVITVVDEGDIVTFRSASNYDVLFSGLVSEITINGEAVTKENVGDKFGAISNTSSGGGEGGLTPEQEQRLNNAVQIADYNADKEAQATIDESQNAAIEGLGGDIEGKQDKIADLDAIREGAEKGATAIQEETDPVWNAEKGNYYTKGETDGLVNEAKTAASNAMSVAASAEGIASAAHSMADEALEELKNKADKGEIPSLDGYATEEWVEGKGYLTEETDPTVPSHVKAITAEDIAKWNEGGKTGEVIGSGEAPKEDVGIGIFNGEGIEIHYGDPINTGDLFYMRPLVVGEVARVGRAGMNIYFNYVENESPYYQVGQNTNWTVYNENMQEEPDYRITKGSALYARWNGENGTLFNVNIFTKVVDSKSGVYIYDGSDEPSKVATEKTLEEYATEEWVEGKGYLTEHQDISGKLDKTEAAETYQPKGNYATKDEIPSLDGYATEEWVEGKGYLTEHQDISGKLDKSEAEETYQPKGDYALKNDLEGYVGVETYNQHITDQSAIDEAQNSAIEGIEGDITRIDSKIDDIELFKFPNATIIGEPTVQSGQVSNFSSENYLQFPFVLDLRNQTFQIDFCFTTSDNVSGQQNVLDSKFGIALAVKDGKGLMAISSNGTSWNIGSVIGTMTIEPNTTYYARLTWDGIQYKTFLSTDGTSYTQDMVLNGTERPFPTTIFIGGCDLSETGHTAHPFLGTINMNKAQLTVMGNVVWQGMDDAGLATRLATNLNNIDEVGKERIKEIVGTIPTKTSELTNDSGFLTEHQSLDEYAKTADVEANYQPKGDYLTEETDPVWNSEKGNYYDKEEIEGMFAQADATYQPKGNYATKDEIPSLDGYATEEWVEGKGYLTEHQSLEGYAKTVDVNTELEKKQDVITDLDEIRDGAAKGATAIQEHQDISGKQDVITDLGDIREGAALGKTALQSFTETDPTVPAHVKAITEEDIAKWNQGGGGGSTNYLVDARPSDLQDGKGIITDLVEYVKQWVTFQSYIHNVTEEESKLKFYLTETKYTSKKSIGFIYDGQYLFFNLSNKFEYVSGDKSKLRIYRKSDDTLIEDFISEDPDSIYFKFNEGPLEMWSFDIGIDKTLWYYADKVFEGPYLVKGSEYTQIPTVNQFVKVKGKPILDSTDIDEYTVRYDYYNYPSKLVFQVFKNGKAVTDLKDGDVAYMRFNKEKNTDSTYRYPTIKYGYTFEITIDPDTVFIHFDVKGCCCWFTVQQNLQYNLVSVTNIKTINGESIL